MRAIAATCLLALAGACNETPDTFQRLSQTDFETFRFCHGRFAAEQDLIARLRPTDVENRLATPASIGATMLRDIFVPAEEAFRDRRYGHDLEAGARAFARGRATLDALATLPLDEQDRQWRPFAGPSEDCQRVMNAAQAIVKANAAPEGGA